MKINAISIVPQEVGCNANCNYCIAHLTKNVRKDLKRPGINLPKLEKCLKYVKSFNASTAIVTSCGENLCGSWTNIENILWLCKKYFGQIDLHTNGIEILNPPKHGKDFSQMIAPYISNVTITVPHYNKDICKEHGLDIDHKELFKILTNLGIAIRLSCVVYIGGIDNAKKMKKYIQYYSELGVSQIVFREMWIPNWRTDKGPEEKIYKWCDGKCVYEQDINGKLRALQIDKHLNWWGNGQPYEIDEVAVSTSTCTQNVTKDIIKSVVYRPDNNLYPDWDTKCRIM